MNNNQLTIIQNNVKGQLSNKFVAPLIIAGSPGIGKSSALRGVATELDMNIVEFSCPTLTIEFLSGLPNETTLTGFFKSLIVRVTDKVIGTTWSMPEMLTSVWKAAEEKPTILLLDDFHGMAPHLQSYFYQLLLDRKLGNYRLPDNVAILGTMNDSDLAGFNGISSAIRNRLSILKLEFNFEYWFNNFGNRLHYLVASFLKAKPHYCQEPETTTIEGYATARAWTAIAAELQYHNPEFINSNAKALAGSQVSAEAATAFQAHANYVSALNFEKTVSNRQLVDLSTKDPLDSIIYAYITNFINTIDDGMYLLDLMETNSKEAASAFIGFVIGELYIKYTHQDQLSDGLKYVIDRLLGTKPNPDTYPNVSKEKLAKAFAKSVPSISIFQDRASEFLL